MENFSSFKNNAMSSSGFHENDERFRFLGKVEMNHLAAVGLEPTSSK